MESSILGGAIGLVGGTLAGIGEEFLGNGFEFGYTSFNQNFVNPTLQNIRDSAPNKEGYDAGYVTGIVVPLASGLLGLVNSPGKIQSTVNIVSVTNGVASGELALDGASAIGLINSFVQASIGVGTGGTSGNNKPDTTELKFESATKSEQKLNNEMKKRGWTKETVKETVNNPYTTRKSTNKANGNSATVYYKESGAYVVVDDFTKEVIQISDNNNPSTWTPDSGIIDPYKP